MTQQAKLTANDAQEGDELGWAVAIDGDTAVVGSYEDDDAGSDAGSAYVYVRSGSTWTLQAKLLSPDGGANDLFGHAVAIAGDTIAVGARRHNSFAGGVWIFQRSETTWQFTAKLTPGDSQPGDQFGLVLEISDDGNTLVIGASTDDELSLSNTGSAYVFVRSGSSWSEQGKLVAFDAQAEDWFGGYVAVSGDGNTLAVGAQGDDDKGPQSGSVYVYVRSGSTWLLQAKIFTPDQDEWDYVGSVALSTDGNRLALGARRDDDRGSDSGSAYVFQRSGSSWSFQSKLLGSGTDDNDWFGSSLVFSDDGSVLVVGAYGDPFLTPDETGAAYVYTRNGSNWNETSQLVPADAGIGDEFSYSLGLSGNTLIVGANGHDLPVTDAGASYVYLLDISGDPPPGGCQPPGAPNRATATTASGQWGVSCGVHPGDACDADTFTVCSPDSANSGERVINVTVSTYTPGVGQTITVSCVMGDGGDSDTDRWELWYHDGMGWVQKASFTDPDGCGPGIQSCTWGPHNLTVTGCAGIQALRCINHYFDSSTTNACRAGDSWWDVDELQLNVSP